MQKGVGWTGKKGFSTWKRIIVFKLGMDAGKFLATVTLVYEGKKDHER